MKGLCEAAGIKLTPIDPANPDGVALTSAAHPPGLIDDMANTIRSGKLRVERPHCSRHAHFQADCPVCLWRASA
jgi:hypothetical protein